MRAVSYSGPHAVNLACSPMDFVLAASRVIRLMSKLSLLKTPSKLDAFMIAGPARFQLLTSSTVTAVLIQQLSTGV